MIYFQKYSIRNKNISVLKFISNFFYIGYDDGILEIYSHDFNHRLFSKKIHSSIIFNIFKLKSCYITFSLTGTSIWDFEWNHKNKMVNILFHKICPLHEEKIIFGSISGGLYSWNQKTLTSIPFHFFLPSTLHLLKISEKEFISYNSTEMIIWEEEKKKYIKKKENNWISTIEIFNKDYLLIGHDSIILFDRVNQEEKQKWSSFPSIFTSILTLDSVSFITISVTGFIYLYNIEKNTEECIQKGFGHYFFPVSFIQSKKDIFFFYEQFIFQFQNPLLKREEENYNLFLNSIKNLKKDYIFHNHDISYLLSTFLF